MKLREYCRIILISGVLTLNIMGADAAMYYVNDVSTNGDVYTSAPGNDLNAGTNPSLPKLTITNLLATYILSGGDTVYIDTGVYSNQLVWITNSGSSGNFIVFQGSTNSAGGGTVVERNDTGKIAIGINGVNYCDFRNITVCNAGKAFYLANANNCRFYSIHCYSNVHAVYAAGSINDRFVRCLFEHNNTCMRIDNSGHILEQSVVWNNTLGFENTASAIVISNSIIAGGTAFAVIPERGDYNIFWNTKLHSSIDTLIEMQEQKDDFWHCTFADPLFLNPEWSDFHLRSAGGVFSNGVWVTNDTVFSPGIDFGNKVNTGYTNEPMPNGSCINVGLYGATEQASKSRTNAWLLALTYNDGGTLFQTGSLYWTYGSFTNGALVDLEYSVGGGAGWTNIAGDIPVTNGQYTWATTGFPASLNARWRVVSAEDSGIMDMNNTGFIVRTSLAGFDLYVNDHSTNGDVYCSQPGQATNNGLTPTAPMLSLQAILDTYDLGAGDTVYIDTGTYTNPVSVSAQDSGVSDAYVKFVGSTNLHAGGSVIEPVNTSSHIISLRGAKHLHMENLILRDGNYGLYLYSSGSDYPKSNSFRSIWAVSNTVGFAFNNASYNYFQECLSCEDTYGIRTVGGSQLLNQENHWNHGIIYNSAYAMDLDWTNTLTSSNSVISGGAAFVDKIAHGDYNVLWNCSIKDGVYSSLAELQLNEGTWWRSTYGDPLFANGSGLDFHPKSKEGRYDPASEAFVIVDTNVSVIVDFGDPLSLLYTNELLPNGQRLNAGIYGGTDQASKSDTNAWLAVLSFNDGGVLDAQSAQEIYWNYGNVDSNEMITIQLSRDSGASWITVETNVLATNGVYTWETTNIASSTYAKWRIILASDTNVWDENLAVFSFRNGPFIYYVNDSSTNGDVYTTMPGSSLNLGVSPSTPKAALYEILSAYDLGPGDIVYLDTGLYYAGTDGKITALDMGTNNNPVTIQGSTNYVAGGAILARNLISPSSYVLKLDATQGQPSDLTIKDLTFFSAGRGLWLESATRIVLDNVTVRNCISDGIYVEGGSNNVIRGALVSRNGDGIELGGAGAENLIEHTVFWRNTNTAVKASNGWVMFTNNVVVVSGVDAYGYYTAGPTNIIADYNAVYCESNGVAAYVQSMQRNMDVLGAWVNVTSQDTHSICSDPLFADPDNRDFHLKTATPLGRRTLAGDLTSDLVTSPLIDSGSPFSSYANEPIPNGGRVNIGRYGNTWQASVGRTNAWMEIASLKQGGWVSGVYPLAWLASGAATDHVLKVEYSQNGGLSWSILHPGIDATNGCYWWDTTLTNDTPAGLWRVSSLTDTNLVSANTNFFSVRNTNLNIYVNDHCMTGDVFTATNGAPYNWMATQAQPVDSIVSVFQRYNLEPGDTVWVDTGYYTGSVPIVISRYNGGMPGMPVNIVGNASNRYNASVFDRQSTDWRSRALTMEGVHFVTISNLVLRGAVSGVVITNASDIMFSARSCNNVSNGIVAANSANVSFRRAVIDENGDVGLSISDVSSLDIDHSLICSNHSCEVSVLSGNAEIKNSILKAGAVGGYVFDVGPAGSLSSDYNNILHVVGANVGLWRGQSAKYLSDWQALNSNDLHSLSHDPRFAAWGETDFHLKSMTGRYAPGGAIVTDLVASVLIDAGAPASSYTNEPFPNGERVNIGLYGDHPEASRSKTNSWLLALTLNAGGTIRGTNYIYWTAGGEVTGSLATLAFSWDGGVSWTNIATNVAVAEERYFWCTTNFPSTPLGVWRIIAQDDTNIFGVTENYFALKNEPLGYYVNDANTNGDVYTTAPGNPLNDGLRPSTPKSSLADIINMYVFDPGDEILVDTGYYELTNSLMLNRLAGEEDSPIGIRGSTNYAMGGSLFDAGGIALAVDMRQCANVRISHMSLTNVGTGIRQDGTSNCLVSEVNVFRGGNAFTVQGGRSNSFERCAAMGFLTNGLHALEEESVGTRWWGGVMMPADLIDSNGIYITTGTCVFAERADITVGSSVFLAAGANDLVYKVGIGRTILSEYNNFVISNNANLAIRLVNETMTPAPFYYATLSAWARETGNDLHSLSHDPEFANMGDGDFHLLSQGGRYDPSTDTFVYDPTTSVLLDAGNPEAVYTNELDPNGARINIGKFGNSDQASKTPTNGSLTTVSLNDGGFARGTNFMLYWIARGDATGHTVRLDFSPDAGASWQMIAQNISATNRAFSWDTTAYTTTVRGVWSIRSETNSTISNATRQLFGVRNSPVHFFVNDTNTDDDVYCSEPGDAAHSGLSPDEPMLRLQDVLATYDLEGGDVVYIDTGIYSNEQVCLIGQLDTGSGTNRVTIQGSTNQTSARTVFQGRGIRVYEGLGVEIRHIDLHDFRGSAFHFLNCTNSVVEWTRAIGGDNGYVVENSYATRFSHCVGAHAVSNGLMHVGSHDTDWNHGVLWSNDLCVVAQSSGKLQGSYQLHISNSILAVYGSGGYVYRIQGTPLTADYNCYIFTNDALLATESADPIWDVYKELARWSRDTGRDIHSVRVDPGCADPAGGDFHLRSQAGRFDPVSGGVVTDIVSSLLIDAGDASEEFGDEPLPNGDRLNIGLYGNTWQASRTPTNARLQVISLYDGGRCEGLWPLYWLAQGDATGHTVRIEYSPDAGATWIVLTTDIPAADGFYSWDTTLVPNSVRALWAVISQDDSSVSGYSIVPFAIRNGPVSFYVNDSSTNGDVYCEATGSSGNLGLTPATPKAMVQQILSAYDLESGDTVFVDTGTYGGITPITIDQFDSAGATNVPPVLFLGSTNYAAGGTVIARQNGPYGFDLDKALRIELHNFFINGASVVGLRLSESYSSEFQWLQISGCGQGVEVVKSDNVDFAHISIYESAGQACAMDDSMDVRWNHGVIWSNKADAIVFEKSVVDVRNSIFGVFESEQYVYRISSGSVSSDYNCIIITNGARVAYKPQSQSMPPDIYFNVGRWAQDEQQDTHTLTDNPEFLDAAQGDFHLLSRGGRYDPGTTSYVYDSISSPLIDAGNPESVWTNELAPNGSRVNIGLYGNTGQASKTATNAAFSTITFNDGGIAKNLVTLRWIAHGDATNHAVKLDFSPDMGLTWQSIVSGVVASDGESVWNTTLFASTVLGKWRITSLDDPSVVMETKKPFAVRNAPLSFYVNDDSLVGDIYTDNAIGHRTNWGTAPNIPKASLAAVFDAWDIEQGDTIYVDTGTYLTEEAVHVDRFDAGVATNDSSLRVAIIGSTNDAFGGSVLYMFAGRNGIELDALDGFDIRHMTIKGANVGFALNDSTHCSFEFVRATQGGEGVKLSNCDSIDFRHCAMWQNRAAGLNLERNSYVSWINGVLWSNAFGIMNDEHSGATVYNSAFGCFGGESVAFLFENMAVNITSDYNTIYLSETATCASVITDFGAQYARTTRYVSVAKWQERQNKETYSLAVDPGFYEPSIGDFHIKSSYGRYRPGIGWTNDPLFQSSRMIDAGSAQFAYTNEPMPNGGRINVGQFGNTGQASMTPTNGWYSCITFNDGGSGAGLVELRWFAGWIATGHLVRIDFNPYNGRDGYWTNVVSNWPASTLSYWWDSTDYGRSALGRWRITSEDESYISDTTDVRFVLRNGGTIPYYVNDASTNGDVYCNVAGSPDFDGITPDTPLDSIQEVIDRYELEPVDIVYIDSGTYNIPGPVRINDLDSGFGTNHVIFQGSTNAMVPTLLNCQNAGSPGILLQSAAGIELHDIVIQNGLAGVEIVSSEDCLLKNIRAQNNRYAGFSVNNADNIAISHCLAWNNGTTNGCGIESEKSVVICTNVVLWNNYSGINIIDGGSIQVRNSILHAVGGLARVFNLNTLSSPSVLDSDYNDIYAVDGALVAEKKNEQYGSDYYPFLADWQKGAAQDLNSISIDPLFADAVSGDFHLRSQTGRYSPYVGWTNDIHHSPLIDIGDPSFFTNEPSPNGGVANIGMYGLTTNASMSRTGQWLIAKSLNEGGVISGIQPLRWDGGNIASGQQLRLEYSDNGKVSWEVIASNVVYGLKQYDWDVSLKPLLPRVYWQVILEDDTNVFDVCRMPFAIKNHIVSYYVNDSDRDGDVYTTAVGLPYNMPTNPATPLDNPATLFHSFPVGAGDTVFIDTGYYSLTNAHGIEISALNQGLESDPITLLGSYNYEYGGSVIDRNGNIGHALLLQDTKYVQVSHLKLTGARVGLTLRNSLDCTFSKICCYSNVGNGFDIYSGADMQRCASWRNAGNGLNVAADDGAVSWQYGVIWSNSQSAISLLGGNLSMSNSIAQAYRTNSYVYRIGRNTGIKGNDFNVYQYIGDALFAYEVDSRTEFENFSQWQVDKGVDRHSMLLDPLFVDAAAGNFRLQSEAGHGLGWSGGTDTQTSWAIDAGGFNDAYSQEPAPNGARVNVGLYGNTMEASRTLTNDPSVMAVTFSDGGVMWGEQYLYWRHRGLNATNTLRIEFSPDAGDTWILVDTNISIAQNEYYWVDTNPPTPVACWKLTVEGATNLFDQTCEHPFMKRTGPISFYINDASTNGDIYTEAIGSWTNTGFYSNSPLPDISAIFDRYDVGGGDTIYVDTGSYTQDTSIKIGYLDSGSATSLVRIIGSTNVAMGGTCLDFNGLSDSGFYFDFARGIELNDLWLRNMEEGIKIENRTYYIYLNDVVITDAEEAGINVAGACGPVFGNRVVITRCGAGAKVAGNSVFFDSCVIWSNTGSAIFISSDASCSVSNSILYASSPTNYCYYLQTNASIQADYNNLYVISGAHYGVVNDFDKDGLPQWTLATTQDMHSLACDPLFANPDDLDFHVQSRTGRYDPNVGDFVEVDTNFSYLIDTGMPGAPYDEEPLPNGARRNIGLHGNTSEASKSDTNAWLLAVTASSGGICEGLFRLIWAWGGMEGTNIVLLDYSFDDGTAWTNIGYAEVADGQYLWLSNTKDGEAERWPTSPQARWRIMIEADTNVFDITDSYFGLRNHPFIYYLNDGSTNDDVYTTAIGDDSNLGFYPWGPKATLKNLLNAPAVDLAGGDGVLVDSGTYVFNTNDFVVWGLSDQGSPGEHCYIKGNTNALLTYFVSEEPVSESEYLLRFEAGYIDMEWLRFVDGNIRIGNNEFCLQHLYLSNAVISASGDDQAYSYIHMVTGNITVAGSQIELSHIDIAGGRIRMTGTNAVLRNSLIYGDKANVSVAGENITIENNTIVSEATAFVNLGGHATLLNNIIIANGPTNHCILLQNSSVDSDYNNLYARNNAWIGNKAGSWERLLYWQRASGQDLHSISIDPAFVDEAGGDFHLQSVMGHWTSTGFAYDVETSPCIDIGSPSSMFTNEPMPNGTRINMGAYGDTVQASKSRITPWLTAISLSDGGVIRGTNLLQWASGNLGGSDFVRIEYSADGGATWVTSASSVSASAGEFEWDTTQAASSLDALWKIVLIADTSVYDVCDSAFSVRNTNLVLYLNDSSTNNDVYCSTVGDDGNDGLTPATPKRTLQAILDQYDTEAGDVIKVDTGLYPLTSDIRVIWSRGGDDSYGNMLICGSTNFAAGGSVFDRNNVANDNDGIEVLASHVTLRYLTFRDAYRGVFFSTNLYSSVEGLLLYSNTYGFCADGALSLTCRNTRIWNNRQAGVHLMNTQTSMVMNCTFVGNEAESIRLQNTVLDVLQNNIHYLTDSNAVVLNAATGLMENAFMDYNIYEFTEPGQAIWQNYRDLRTWQLEQDHDFRSAITNPLFADLNAGDFHLQSTVGRYVDGSGWVLDGQNSWGIDTGNHASDYSEEPSVNGNRINIGAYGGTIYASKGDTNAIIRVRTLNEATHIDYSNSLWALIWTAQDIPTGVTVDVEYSGDAGDSWVTLADDISAYQEYILWQTTPYWNTFKGMWRVISSDGNYADTNDVIFDIFYGDFEITQIWNVSNLNNIIWRGAWDEHYVVEYSTNMLDWFEAPVGPGEHQTNDFISTHGGDFRYEDIGSGSERHRCYRVRHVMIDGSIREFYIYRIDGVNALVWSCEVPGPFMVEYSTNMVTWSPVASGPGPNQQNPVINLLPGTNTFEDVAATNDRTRSYRIWRQE